MTRRRKIVLIILSVVAVILAVFGVKMYLFFTAKPNIAVNYVAEWNKISKPDNYDPNQNAFFDYQRAAAYFVEMPEIMKPEKNPKWPEWPGDMNDVQLKILKNWLNDNTKAIEYIKEGSKKPYYWDEFPEHITKTWETQTPLLTPFRTCALALCWQARLFANENNIDESLENLLTCYRTGILITGKKRTPIEQIVGISIRHLAIDSGFSILSNIKIDSERKVRFQKHLEEILSEKALKIDYTLEKLEIYDFLQRIFSDDGKGNGHLIPSEIRKLLGMDVRNPNAQRHSFFEIIKDIFSGESSDNNEGNLDFFQIALFGPDRKQHTETIEKIYKYFEDIQEQTPHQLHIKNINPSKKMEEMLKEYDILNFFGYPLYSVTQLNYRQEVEASALLTTIAILRYKDDNRNLPENLKELVGSGYLKELPMDPYNDGPLTYIKTDDGFMLYSFGEDFDDDGGTYSEWGYRGGDQVFWPVVKDEKK